jgi:hypothetical protein
MKKTFTKILCAAVAMFSVSAVYAQQGYEKSNEIFHHDHDHDHDHE